MDNGNGKRHERRMSKATDQPAGREPPQRGPTSARHARRLSREELTPEARDAIFAAAASVIGEHGYVGATIKRITEQAGIAQGTFYLYFDSRQALFDTLLPHIGSDMLRFIRERVEGADNFYDAEERGFRAFFHYVHLKPAFMRILNEAEWAAPVAHRRHFNLLASHYRRALLRAVAQGDIRTLAGEEVEAIAYMLMACRSYVYLHYLKDGPNRAEPPEIVVEAYMKLVRNGLR
jgi:AcrR family transcriptional regulator